MNDRQITQTKKDVGSVAEALMGYFEDAYGHDERAIERSPEFKAWQRLANHLYDYIEQEN
jgi:hypothetical protein